MWLRKSGMKERLASVDIRLVLPKAALLTVFDECDNFTEDETGGRTIGIYTETDGVLTIEVTGIIEPGPGARRSRVSFFQDGAYQEGIFRQVEAGHPEIEHLGNWHTHHVNGLPHLSGGDVETYTRTVNHQNHNTAFFYALLVIAKHKGATGLGRYDVRHYVFRRGDDRYYEIPPERVTLVDRTLVWPAPAVAARTPKKAAARAKSTKADEQLERVKDRDALAEFYEGFRSFSSEKLGFYWRGQLDLADGSAQEVFVLEGDAGKTTAYTIALREPPAKLGQAADALAQLDFPSARQALIAAERRLNRALFDGHGQPED